MAIRAKSFPVVAGHAGFKPYKTSADRAYYELKGRILTCGLTPGSRVDEKILSTEIGVPAEALRGACRRLQRERLVHAVDSRRYGVATFTLDDIRELTEVRRIVESRTAALAAEHARPDEIARLLILAELKYQPGERRTYLHYLAYNTAFHRQLAHASRNARLESAVVSVLEQIQRPLYLGLDVGLDSHEATSEHLEVIDAVRHKRPVLASRLMWDQITSAEKRMVEAFGDNGFA